MVGDLSLDQSDISHYDSQAKLFIDKARSHKDKSELDSALFNYKQALNVYEQLDKKINIGHILVEIGKIQNKQGELKRCQKSYERALSILSDITPSPSQEIGLAHVYYELANLSHDKGDYELAMINWKKALSLYIKHDAVLETAKSQRHIGFILQDNKDKNAIKYFNDAINTFLRLNATTDVANITYSIGQVYHENENYQLALKEYKKALVLYKKTQNSFDEGETYYSLCLVYLTLDKRDVALSYFIKAILNYSINPSLIDKMDGYIQKGRDLFGMEVLENRFDSEIVELNEKLKSNDKPRLMAYLNQQLAIFFKLKGEFNQTIIHAKLSLEQYTQVNDTFRQGRINQLLGIINHHQMDLDQAMGYYNNAIKIFHQLEKYVDTTYSYIGIANAYLVKGEPRNAIEYFENGLLFYEDHIDFLAKASILTGLGNAYRSKGELDKAQELYIQARKLYERSSNPLNEAAILYYLGETYFIRGENDVALENYGRALKIYDQHTSPLDEAKTLTGIGNAYRVEGDLNTSKEKYLQAIKLYEDNNSVDKSHPLKNLAENYILQKKYDEAIKYVTEAMNLLKSNPNKLRIAIPLNKLGRIHYARGDYKKGFIFCAQSAQILEHSPNPQDIFRPLDIIYNYEPKKAVFLSISNPLGINWLLTLINNIHNSGDYLRSSHWYYLWLGVSNWWNIIWSFPSQSAFIDSVFNSNWRIQFLLEESQRNITSETSLNLLFGANDLNTDMTHNYKNFRNPQEELDPMWFVELPTKVYHGERYLKIRVNNLVKIMGERSSFPLSGQTRFPAVARVVFELETQWLQKLRIDHLFYPNSDIEHQKYQLNPSNTWLKDIFVMDMDDKLVSENKLEIIYSVELYFELNKSIPDIKTTSKRITLPIVRKNNLQVLEKFKVNHANSLAVFIAFWSIIITILPLFIDYGRIISKYIDISLTSLTGIFIVILTSFISAFFFKKKNKELLNESVSKSRDEISIEKEEDIGLSLDKINLDNIDFDFSGILDFFRDDSD